MRQPVVVVADDDPATRDLMAQVLQDELGARVVLAADGGRALDAARRERPDVVVLDVMMSVVNGLEVARRLKADPATAAIPLVAVSAHSGRAAVLETGCCAFVAKPFDLDEFVAAVRGQIAGAA